MLEPPIESKRWWHREDLLLLILLGALFYFPGLHRIPLFDRDEPRFAVAARNMLMSGDYIVPRYNGELRPDKPPLVYWLMDAGYQLTGGVSEVGARLPSAVSGILTLIVLYFAVGCRFGRLTGFVAAMMFGSCTLFVVESRMATADGTMILTIACAMALAWWAWDAAPLPGAGAASGRIPRADYLLDRSGDRSELMLDHMPASGTRPMPLAAAMGFWAALAAGALVKGVPLAFVLIPLIVLSVATGALPAQLRQWRSHFHLTRARAALAATVAVLVTLYLLLAATLPALPDMRLWAVVFGVLVMAMVLTPGLPAILGRCLFRGNWGWWRQLRPALGVPLLVVLVGWWVVAAGQATHWQLIERMVGTHFLNRIGLPAPDTTIGGTQDPMKSYGKPPGFYLATVWGTFWPWSILLVPAAYHTVRRLLGKTPLAIDRRPYQFLVAWIVPMWILLELSRGKLFHYPLPVFLALAILCADTLVQSWHRLTDVLAAPWVATMRWVALGIWCSLGLGILGTLKYSGNADLMWRCSPFAVLLMATGFVSAITWGKPSWPYVLTLGWGGSLLVASTLVLPDMPELQVSRLAAQEMVEAKRHVAAVKFGVCRYEDATLLFYAGRGGERLTVFTSAQDILKRVPFERAEEGSTPATTGIAASAPATGPEARRPTPDEEPYVIAVDEATRQALDAARVKYTPLPRLDTDKVVAFEIAGFNAANFKPVRVTVITNLPPGHGLGLPPLPDEEGK